MKYLALDIGSSFIKYAVLQLEEKAVGEIRKLPMPEPDVQSETRYEISAERVWELVENIILRTAEETEDLRGIVLCTQMHGFILANDEQQAITPYISWQDKRCQERKGEHSWFEELRCLECSVEMKNAGVDLKPNLSMSNLYALLQGRKLPEGRIHFCTLGSYLIWRMTGNNICHITNGAPTGLVDIVKGCWNRELIEKTGFGHLCFPRLETGMEPCGSYHVEERSISVFPDFGDHQTCVLGSGVQGPGELNINIGTAGLAGMITGHYQRRAGEVRPYFERQYLNTQRGLFGGRDAEVLNTFFKDVAEKVTGEEVEAARIWNAVCCDRSAGGYLKNGLEIEASFYECGKIGNITKINFTLQNLIGAVYQKVAADYRNALAEILPEGVKLEKITFSGGTVRKNEWLKECIAGALKCDWQDSAIEDESILGLLRIALVCSGMCENLEDTLDCLKDGEAVVA